MNKHFINDSRLIINSLGKLNNKFSGKKILITGAGGFLGKQFLHYFINLNKSAILNKPCIVYAIEKNITKYSDYFVSNKIRFKYEDITKENKFNTIDYIIHAASIASPTYYRMYPIKTMDANVIGLRNLLEHSKRKIVKGFLFFSSSEIYGDPDKKNIPTREEYNGNVSCIGPRACYDESKRYGETLCMNFFRQYRIPIKIVRPFNNYGPGLSINDKRVIPDLFKNVLENNNITLFSNGKSTRTFCYVSDAMEGYLRTLLIGKKGEAYNIGNDKQEISIEKLAKLIIKISNKKLKIVFKNSKDKDYLTDSPKRRCPSIIKARKDLLFYPKISLREGLIRTYKYYLSPDD